MSAYFKATIMVKEATVLVRIHLFYWKERNLYSSSMQDKSISDLPSEKKKAKKPNQTTPHHTQTSLSPRTF